jgi:hypothetical protein
MEKLSAARPANPAMPSRNPSSGIPQSSLELAKGFEPLTL